MLNETFSLIFQHREVLYKNFLSHKGRKIVKVCLHSISLILCTVGCPLCTAKPVIFEVETLAVSDGVRVLHKLFVLSSQKLFFSYVKLIKLFLVA